jgi:hypothetical protein
MAVAQDRRAERSAQIEKLSAALFDQAVAAPANPARRRETQTRNVGNDLRVALAQ